jgi:hypothetical protein
MKMLYLYEIEIFKDDDYYIAVPFDFEGATEGFSKQECLEMAADLLTSEIQHRLMHKDNLPEPTIDNSPQYEGEIYSLAIDTGIGAIPRMLKSEAARTLGISQGRVTQLVKSGKLETFSYQGREYVTKASVDARKEYNDFGSQDGLSGVEQKQDLTQSENYRPQELLYWSPQPCDVMVFKQPKEHVQTQTYDARERM